MNARKIFYLVGSIIVLYSCKKLINNNEAQPKLPPPTETTVKWDMEDGDKKSLRQAYIDLIHGGKDVPWKSIELENTMEHIALKNNLRRLNPQRNEDEWLAGGHVKGRWIERGSNNLAGSINRTAYDPYEDKIYCIGAGGPMFKGSRFDLPWEVVNDDYRFSHGLLSLIRYDEDNIRIIAAINDIPHYSDDNGNTWVRATGISATDGSDLYHQVLTADSTILFLHKYDYWSDIILYSSKDHGETYQALYNFQTSDTRNIAMDYHKATDQAWLIQQVDADRSRLWSYNQASSNMEVVNANSPMAFGGSGRANIEIVAADSLHLYLYDEDNNLQMTQDTGKTWTRVAELPTRPWNVGLFIPETNPNRMFYGEVDAYYSRNKGKNWEAINRWWEYYDNIKFKLHADIMCYDEYTTEDGTPFILIGNHGGLSISYNYGQTNENIGTIGLNVGQFYDVKSYPPNPERVFGGTQDQGLQKGWLNEETPEDFTQIISGDYGHNQFTGPTLNHLWTVYPDGWISFYDNPLSQDGPVASYTIESENETVWIPPIMTSYDPTLDVVYAAGGSVVETSTGSHIIKLEYKDDDIEASELPFDFAVSGGTISAMAISPFDANVWWVHTTNGYMYKSIDGGQSFTEIRKSLTASQYLYGSCILPSKIDSNVVYLSGNGYNANSPTYVSKDGGLTWRVIKKGLPRTVVFKLAANEDESLIFAATEAGPYVYIVEKEEWFSLMGASTPNQTYWSVEYVEELQLARFGTYGRGVWDFIIVGQDPTNVVHNEDNKLNIRPSISHGLYQITIPDNDKGLLEVYQLSGQRVLSQAVAPTATMINLDLTIFQDGIYLLIFKTSKGNTFTQKVVKTAY